MRLDSRMIQSALGRGAWFLREIVTQFSELDLPRSAAALTYMTLFALVPMMTVGYTILSALPEFEAIGEDIRAFIFANFVPAMSEVIEEWLIEFSEQATQLTLIGFAFLVVVAFRMLISIEHAFNRIWNVVEARRGLQRFLVYWSVLTCAPPLIAGGLLITSYLISLPLIADIDGFGLRERVLGVMPTLFSVAAFTVLYYAVPNCRVPLRHAFYGGILTAASFQIAQQLFTMVVARMHVQVIYGAFAAVPLFLAWMYLVWVLILSGGIFVRTLSLKRDNRVGDTDPPLISCLRILELLYRAHLEGRTVTDSQIERSVTMRLDERERVFEVLAQMGLYRRADDDGLALGRNLRTVTLWELYQRLPERIDSDSLAAASGVLPAVTGRLRAFAERGEGQLGRNLEELFDAAADGGSA